VGAEPNEYRNEATTEYIQAMRWLGPNSQTDDASTTFNFKEWGLDVSLDGVVLVTPTFEIHPGEWVIKDSEGNLFPASQSDINDYTLITTAPDGWDTGGIP
jgi:hypothetical protein